jgi:hypothetical protein
MDLHRQFRMVHMDEHSHTMAPGDILAEKTDPLGVRE